MNTRAKLTILSLGMLLGSAIYLAAQESPTPQKPPPPLFKGDRPKKDDNSRTVAGAVRDASDKLADGAVVKLKDMKSLAIRSFITKDNGSYSFQGLSTGVDYELQAESREGAASAVKILSVYDNRREAVINLKMDSKK